MITVVVPIKLPSLANMRGSWPRKARTVKVIRDSVAWHLAARATRPDLLLVDGLTVTMVRIAPRVLDDDNLQGACKPVRDEIARWLGLRDDRDVRIVWCCDQRRGAAREHGVEITISAREACDPGEWPEVLGVQEFPR